MRPMITVLISALLVSDITCSTCWLGDGSVNAVGFSNGSPPEGLTFSSHTSVPQVSGRVTLTASASREVYDDEQIRKGWGAIGFRLNSVSAQTGPQSLDVYYQVGGQSTVTGTTNHPGAKVFSLGETGGKDTNSKVSGRFSGNHGEYSKVKPDPITLVVRKRRSTANWVDHGYGQRSTDVFFLAEGLKAEARATCTNADFGNVTKGTASASGSVKAIFLKAIPTSAAPSTQSSRVAVNLDNLIPLRPYPGLVQPPGRVRVVSFRIQTANGAPVSGMSCDIVDTGPTTGNADADFDSLTPGIYRVYISTTKSLIRRFDLYLQAGTITTVPNYTNYIGDIDQDNDIDSTDLGIVTRLQGVSQTMARWDVPEDQDFIDEDTSFSGEDADLNGDGIVNSVDLQIVQANLGRIGD